MDALSLHREPDPGDELPPALPEWRHRAACVHADPDTFVPDQDYARVAVPAAKAICGRCPVVDACLAEALADPWLVGVWGGLSQAERWALLRDDGAEAA